MLMERRRGRRALGPKIEMVCILPEMEWNGMDFVESLHLSGASARNPLGRVLGPYHGDSSNCLSHASRVGRRRGW